MVTATEWLKKTEAKRSKSHSKFKAERRRAWDYIEPPKQIESSIPVESIQGNENKIWEPKKEQSGNVNRNNIGTIWEQNGNEIGSNREPNKEQFESKSSNKYKNNQQTLILNEAIHDPEIFSEDTVQKKILTLTGHQKQVMRHITSHIKSRVGAPYIIDILPNILAVKIKANLEVTRVTLKRLVSKNLLIRLTGERGRNGYCKFQLHEKIVKMCFSVFNDAPSDINLINNEIGNSNGNNQPYSSSFNYIKNTTTVLPDNWEQIDFSPLTEIGFSKIQLTQLFEKKLNHPDLIQESINHFAFGLENNPKIKAYSDPLNVFMGVLRKGRGWVEKDYIAPQEKALKDFYERKKNEKEKRDLMIRELIDLEFPDWRKKLTPDDIKNIVPAETLKANLAPAITAALRKYFIDEVLMSKIGNENS